MKEFRFGYADGYIGSPLKLSDGSLTLIGIRRGIERPNKVIVNFSIDAKLTEQEEKNLNKKADFSNVRPAFWTKNRMIYSPKMRR